MFSLLTCLGQVMRNSINFGAYPIFYKLGAELKLGQSLYELTLKELIALERFLSTLRTWQILSLEHWLPTSKPTPWDLDILYKVFFIYFDFVLLIFKKNCTSANWNLYIVSEKILKLVSSKFINSWPDSRIRLSKKRKN